MKGKYVILEKIDGSFRQDLPIGNKEIQGYVFQEFKIDFPILFFFSAEDQTPCAWTSKVVSVDLEKQIIKTKNSTYKFEIRDENNL